VKSLRSFALALLALALAFPAFADNPATKQWVLATAKATGAGGEQFVSSLRIVNPGTLTANVTLTYLAQSPIDSNNAATGDNTSAVSTTVQVPAGQMLPIEDVIGTKFGGSGPFGIVAGGIKVVSDQPVSVLSRTYVANAVSSTGKPGTYGFSIPAQIDDQAIAAGDTGYVPYIAAAPDRTSGFRCNFIMLNTAASTTVVNVILKKKDGTIVGQRDYTLGNLSAAQQGDIAASFGYSGPDENLFLVVSVKSGGPVVVGTSIIDNAISSLNYAPPTKTVGGASGVKDGVYGIVFKSSQDPFGMTARLDLFGGAVQYMAFSAVPDGCQFLYWYQAAPISAGGNTTFTKQADGSVSYTGGETGTSPANWNGTIQFSSTGVTGTLNFSRPASASSCGGQSVHYDFTGTWAASLSY
jgi:hypothetical protein